MRDGEILPSCETKLYIVIVSEDDDDALLDWQRSAPYAEINHPSTEHFDPIFVARGAAAGETSRRLHASYEFGSLSMNAYAFGA